MITRGKGSPGACGVMMTRGRGSPGACGIMVTRGTFSLGVWGHRGVRVLQMTDVMWCDVNVPKSKISPLNR